MQAYYVSQRTREIGVRMALGSDNRSVQFMVLRQVGVMIAIGVVLGALGAFGLGKVAQSLLYGLEGHDPAVFAVSAFLLGAVAFATAWLTARRTSETEPMRALRYE